MQNIHPGPEPELSHHYHNYHFHNTIVISPDFKQIFVFLVNWFPLIFWITMPINLTIICYSSVSNKATKHRDCIDMTERKGPISFVCWIIPTSIRNFTIISYSNQICSL